MAGRVLIKQGVTFVPVWAGFVILTALKDVAKTLDVELMITSGSDGAHSGPNDPHKRGEAYDVRSKSFGDEQKNLVLDAIRLSLNSDYFYASLESPGDLNEHFHIQRRQFLTYTVQHFLNV